MIPLASNIVIQNICITAVVAGTFWFLPAVFRRGLGAIHSAWSAIARRAAVSILAVAALPLALRLLLLPVLPVPVPRIHDEFSYLLAADTFASGRITNPPHPLWQFFETFHVLPTPTYMSKYPPAQAMFLAIGQVVFGHPWWGVFLSVGVMCGAAVWALRAWVPPNWALLGGLAIAIQFGVTNYWMNSYWGGAPAAIGGALLLGAFGSLKQYRPLPQKPIRNAVFLALGAGLLLNSRPWEGAILMVPVGLGLAYWVFKPGFPPFSRKIIQVVVPICVLLMVMGAAMLEYNRRITGNALVLPYRLCHATYSVAPLFLWETRTPAPEFRHAVMKRFYLDVEPAYQDANTLNTFTGWLAVEKKRLRMIKDILFGNVFLLLCASLLLVLLRRSETRILLAVLSAAIIALSVESWCQPHYLGPVLVAAAALKLTSLRYLSTFRLWGRRVGLASVTAVIAFSANGLIQKVAADRPSTAPFQFQRAAIEKELESTAGSHVVMVRYSNDHVPTHEWVYNHSDIDRSKVVWAREMSHDENQRLLEYYRDRNVWLLDADQPNPLIVPYPGAVETVSGRSAALRPEPPKGQRP
ncbi:MAG: hypothetical protein ABI759_05925 [Candidatus Solibacter sp.]